MFKIICVARLDIGRMTRSQEQIAFGENWAKEATWWLFLWYFIDIRGLSNGVHINWDIDHSSDIIFLQDMVGMGE